jgi:hypothetical protein
MAYGFTVFKYSFFEFCLLSEVFQCKYPLVNTSNHLCIGSSWPQYGLQRTGLQPVACFPSVTSSSLNGSFSTGENRLRFLWWRRLRQTEDVLGTIKTFAGVDKQVLCPEKSVSSQSLQEQFLFFVFYCTLMSVYLIIQRQIIDWLMNI